jgi:hypothetical protein
MWSFFGGDRDGGSSSREGQEKEGMIASMNDTPASIMTSETFAHMVEDRVFNKGMTYIDACLDVCTMSGLEPESVPRLIGPKIKKLIQSEALGSNLIKRNGAKLPI